MVPFKPIYFLTSSAKNYSCCNYLRSDCLRSSWLASAAISRADIWTTRTAKRWHTLTHHYLYCWVPTVIFLVSRGGNRVRLITQLVGGNEGFNAWCKSYNRIFYDVFAIQRKTAFRVVNELKTAMSVDNTLTQINLAKFEPATYRQDDI